MPFELFDVEQPEGRYVWIAYASCGDYYCEWCGDGHVLGVYSTEEAANKAVIAAESIATEVKRVDGSVGSYQTYSIFFKEGTQEVLMGARVEKIEVDATPRNRDRNLS